jgi:predicted phosphodiesterase
MDRVQYLSDLHLERVSPWNWPSVLDVCLKPSAATVILAGDMGSDRDGSLEAVLQCATERWRHVVYVMGNHEFYDEDKRSVEDIEAAVGALVARFPSVHWLHHGHPEWVPGEDSGLPPCVFIGCTLWADVAGKATGINDFKASSISPDSMSAMWQRDTGVLARCLARWREAEGEASAETGRKIVVVTHHMPSFGLISPKYAMAQGKHAFASRSEWLMPGVSFWVYGHTHDAGTKVMEPGCVCCVNAVGYMSEHTGFDPAAAFVLG